MEIFILHNQQKNFFCNIKLNTNAFEVFEEKLIQKLNGSKVNDTLILCVPMNFFDNGIFDKEEILIWNKDMQTIQMKYPYLSNIFLRQEQ